MGRRRDSNGRRTGQPIPAEVAPMGRDLGYGEGGEALAAMKAIPAGQPPGPPPGRAIQNSSGQTVAQATTAPPANAMEAARAYLPDVAAMNAPDDDPTLDVIAGLAHSLTQPDALRENRVNNLAKSGIAAIARDTGDIRLAAIANDWRLGG